MPQERRIGYDVLSDKLSDLTTTVSEGFSRSQIQYQFLAEKIDVVSKSQEKVNYSLHGNGKEGLLTTVAKLNQKMKLVWCLIGFISSSIATVLTMFIVKQIT